MFSQPQFQRQRRFSLAMLTMLASAPMLMFGPAQAQTAYPNRPIKLVVGFAPGGPTDVQARLLANKLGPVLGQSIIIENRPGASTTIALAEVARANPDGYTLYFGGSGAYATTPLSMSNLAYDPAKSFRPVAMVGEEQIAFAVAPSVPATNMSELLALVKANPGKYAFGSSGQGNITHLTGELFKHRAGDIDLVHVAYKGAAPAVNDALAGHVAVVVGGLSSVYTLHQEKKLRVLAITSANRVPYASDIPTATESGVKDLLATSTLVLLAPARSPDAVVSTLSEAIRKVMSQEAYQQDMRKGYVEPVLNSKPEKTSQLLTNEIKLWSDLVEKSGIKVN